ncbi:hypothetical protein EJB05_49818 [Eragrostis curvula]|uniref:Histone-lysine N-methyltransferase NSD-like PHD zinc finger domain-containing protein n=1 Tax=Eragrostis curvula TaxID=38414 RepID=A0A5J9T5G4_9POAL|nr:hypothetical protein EJB05_49818 [Eragrostis curvula]
MMFDDDDDDGVEPQFKAVDKYYFEDGDGNDVCFSMLPFLFDENEKGESCNSNMEVYLRGLGDKRDDIHVKVTAWRIELGGDQPKIFMLSKDNWIRLLKPRNICAKKVFGSILITVQMLHFTRKNLGDMGNNFNCLWSHLDEVFSKFDIKPTPDDLRQHHNFIMLFAKRDPILMNSKILQKFEGYPKIKKPGLKAIGTKVQFIVDDEKGYNSNGDNNHEDTSDDDYSHNEDENNDDSSDGHSDNDDGADPICAMCDDGGKLLSCKGQCKRAFHATKKHGQRSKCITLGYTSAQQKVFRCNNPSCGHFYHPKCIAELLEPDDTGGVRELAKRIAAGMSFICPVHWCFKCERMEDKADSAFQLAVCRRCPVSYHRNCLPRKISLFKVKQKTKEHGVTSGWEHRRINFFYCPDHIDKATNKVRKDHMKLPSIPEANKTRDLAKKKVKLTGKRKHNVDQPSTRPREPSKRSPQKERERNQSAATESSSDLSFLEPPYAASEQQTVLETECATKHFIEDMQLKSRGIQVTADLHSLRAVEGLGKQSDTSFAVGRSQMKTSYLGGSDTDNRVTSIAEKEISSGVLHVSTKSVMPSSRNVFDHSIQENMEISEKNGHQCVVQKNTVCVNQKQDIMLDNPLVEKDAEQDNESCEISDDKDDNGSEETSEHYSGIERGHRNNENFDENNEQTDEFDNLIGERHTEEDDCNIQSGKEKIMERGNTASAHDPSQSAEERSCRENPMFGNECKQDSRSYEDKIVMTDSNKSCSHDDGGAWPNSSDDHCSEKQVHVARQEFGCCENHEEDDTRAGLKEPNSTHCHDNVMDMERERRGDRDGKVELDASRKYNHVENAITVPPLIPSSHLCLPNHKELDGAETQLNHLQCNDEISADKFRERIVPNRTEELSMRNRRDALYNSPLGGNVQERSGNHSVEWQSMYNCDSFPVTHYQGYEQVYHGDCSCYDYFTCRKYCPKLDYDGVIKYGGYHTIMDVDPAVTFSLQETSNTAFRPCTDITVGGGAVYDGRDSWGSQARSAMPVTERVEVEHLMSKFYFARACIISAALLRPAASLVSAYSKGQHVA